MSTDPATGPATGPDAISVLTADHREVEELFTRLEQISITEGKVRRDLADEVIMELVRHSVAEEQYLYPEVRNALPRGDELAEKEIREHAVAEETMKKLDGLDPSDPDFDRLLRMLISEIRHHVEGEEQELFPQLVAACSGERLRELGEKINTAKQVAPTRPHPMAPDRPPMNKLLAPGTGLVDKVRDALTGRGPDQT